MKFRHVGVSVDQMHEILKHSAHQKEERTVTELDEEEKELIKSITFRIILYVNFHMYMHVQTCI